MELMLKFAIPLVLVSYVYGQDTGLILSKTGTVVEKAGAALAVSCQLSKTTPGYDTAIYDWFGPSTQKIETTNSLDHVFVRDIYPYGKKMTIYKLVDDDSGLYKCEATSGQEVYTANFTLEVQRGITFSNCPSKQRGVMGKEAKIRCQASGNSVTTQWEQNGVPIPIKDSRYRVAEDSLIISGVNDSDAGVYKYVGQSTITYDTSFRDIQLEIVVAPKIVSPIREGIAKAGLTHTMFCSADGRPLPTMQWYKGGTLLRNTDRLKVLSTTVNGVMQGTLEFDPVMKEDEGRYTCKAIGIKISDEETEPLENSTSIELKVYTPPKVQDMTDLERSEGGGAELVCIVNGDPAPEVNWQRADTGTKVPSSEDVGITVTEGSLTDPNNPGKEVKLQFSSLKSADAGLYKCVAKNEAGDDENTVELKVIYKPTFDDQEPGPFYTWLGYTNGYIPCTGKGNPAPTFRWYKLNEGNPEEVTSANLAYTVTREEDPEDPYKVTSKLLVTYTGSNRVVFGDYRCVATNKVGETMQTLAISEGLVPQPPLVSAHEVYATQMIFWIYDPPVNGPPVTRYKINYNKNGTDVNLFQQKEDKVFTDDKSGDPKTKFIIKPLFPRTTYTFYIHAVNLVGEGPAREKTLDTKPLSPPGLVKILNNPTSSYPRKIDLIWEKPDNGGSAILEYHLSYRQVNVKPNNATLNPQLQYELDERNPYVGQESTVTGIKDTRYSVSKGIAPGQYYMVKVTAMNGQGPGLPGQTIIKTQEGVDGISTVAIIGILIAVFLILFIIVDVFCFFKSNCGVIMTIRETCGGGRGDEGYSAAKTDDVENLAKKDELTEEAKAAEENETGDGQEADEKKEPLLSEEQKVDTVDEVNALPEKELEPEEKEEIKPETKPETESKPAETSATEGTTEPPKDTTDEKPSELAQD